MVHYSWDNGAATINSQSTQADTAPPGLVAVPPPEVAAGSTVLTVGAGEEFSTLNAAVNAAQTGDVILVNAGTYVNDFAIVTKAITIEGVGGMANFVATEAPPDLKGILTVDNNVTVENCSFSGCAIPEADGGNGAGIRYEGGVMVLENDAFSNNQNGIMGSPVISSLTTNTISIDHCLFQDNGAGDGYTHNAYIGNVSELTFTNNISEGAVVGHELKSRAYVNVITNNVFQDGATGTASYEIDLPNGGIDTVEDNVIEKGPNAQNNAAVHFGGEGIPYADSSLLVEGNSFVNDYGASEIAVLNQTATAVTITGNQFDNIAASNLAQGPAVETNNTNGQGDPLPNGTLTGVLPGSTVIYTDDAAHTISLAGTILAVEGGGGLLTATAVNGHVIAIGGTGGMNYIEDPTSGGNTVTTMAGSTNTLDIIGQDVISSAGTDSIACGANNVTGEVTGTATIADGTGNNQWSIAGTASITGQGGNPVVSVANTGDANILGSVGYLYVQNNGGDFSYSVGEGGHTYQLADTGGAVDAQIAGGTMSITTSSGPVGADLVLGAGTALVTSAGYDTIHAGSGNDTVILEGGATVYAGSGSLSIYGRSDSVGATVYGNGGTYLFAGDSGNITYYGGNLASIVHAQLSNMNFVGGAGLMTLLGGSDETITGGAGGLVYTAVSGSGADQITTEAGATDTLTLASSDVVNSYGQDTISEGSGNQTLNVFGDSKILGGTGSNQVLLAGTDTLFGVGEDSITVRQGANVGVRAGLLDSINETGATQVNFSVTGASESQVIVNGGGAQMIGGHAASNGITISTDAGLSTKVNLAQGTDTLYSYGKDTIHAGTGADTVYILGQAAAITGGTGSLNVLNYDTSAGDTQTITGGAGAVNYQTAGGALHFIGGTGSASIDGGSGSLYITGGAGSLSVTGGTASMHFTGGTGFASLALTPDGANVTFGAGTTDVQIANWGAGNVFNFASGHGGGTDTINGFRAGTDSLVFSGVHVASETISGGSTSPRASRAPSPCRGAPAARGRAAGSADGRTRRP